MGDVLQQFGDYYTNRGAWGWFVLFADLTLGVATAGFWLAGRWLVMGLGFAASDEDE